jgi:aryl-alcohol dehydrogenase-like predicted oxidoreductase
VATFAPSARAFRVRTWSASWAWPRGLGEVAADLGVTSAQLAIAWVAAQGEDIVSLVGARRRDRLEESLGALAVDLSPSDLERIEAVVPRGSAAGERYAEALMTTLDSER